MPAVAEPPAVDAATDLSVPEPSAAAVPEVLDRFLWTLVKDADAAAFAGMRMTDAEVRRMEGLRDARDVRGLSPGEELELDSLEAVHRLGGLVKGAAVRKLKGWRGPDA